MMKKIIIFVFLFIILTTNFILFSREDCRTIELFKPKYSFRSEHIKTCFSTYNFKENIKNIARNYTFLYNVAKKLEATLFPSKVKKDAYVRPHKHMNRLQSFHLISGKISMVFFNNYGLNNI